MRNNRVLTKSGVSGGQYNACSEKLADWIPHAEEEFGGTDRAEYGTGIIVKLAKALTSEYGKGFTKSNLYNFYSFYKTYPDIFQTVSGKSSLLLSGSHHAILLQVKDKKARAWYEKEALEQNWGVRTLQRNVSSPYV